MAQRIKEDKTTRWDETYVSVANGSRTYRQFLDMAHKAEYGICPFCPEHFDHEKNKIIRRVGNKENEWRLWDNPYPHAHTKAHFVIAPKRHIDHPHSMSWEDWRNWSSLVDFVVNAEIGFGLEGGAIAMRFGTPSLNAGSIRHLHTNIMMPGGTGEVRVTLAKDQKKIRQNEERLRAFDLLRSHKVHPDDAPVKARSMLSSHAYELVKDRLS